MTKDAASLMIATYGPFAFGVVSFLAIWFTAVKPELDKRAIDWQTHNETLQMLTATQRQQAHISENMTVSFETMKATGETMRATAETMKAAAKTLDDVARRMESAK